MKYYVFYCNVVAGISTVLGVTAKNMVNLVIIYLLAYENRTDSVQKHRHIKFRRRGITQKNTYSMVNVKHKAAVSSAPSKQ
jgi:hypothetical protein